jgi:hypothetical protein
MLPVIACQLAEWCEDSPLFSAPLSQVLLSQQHRQRALEHLDRFLSLGPWAVFKALSVGIFPLVNAKKKKQKKQ